MTDSKELLKYTKELTILFAEDHKELRESTSEILQTLFKEVSSVSNGKEALELYKSDSKRFDIVLSDIQMPYINGVELVDSIYTINPNQTIIIISAYDDSKYLLPLINLGIAQFIKKPIDEDELKTAFMRVSKKLKTSNIDTSNESSKVIKLDESYTFDKEKNLLNHNDNNISLTKYEIIFLQLISDNVGKVYANENIVDHYKSVNEKLNIENIRKIVSKLRKKIPENSVESIYGIGYRLLPHIA